MTHEFKRISETNPSIFKVLRPDLGLRSWSDFTQEERELIWRHLQWFFFDPTIKYGYTGSFGSTDDQYTFVGNERRRRELSLRIMHSVQLLNAKFKYLSPARAFLASQTLLNACSDFYKIFTSFRDNIGLELISCYIEAIFTFYEGDIELATENFNEFADVFNETLSHFGLEYTLTKNGFLPKVDNIIFEEIYYPVMESLASIKWKPVNELFTESFAEYRRKTPEGYSTCLTKTISTLQAFLQILVENKIGDGDLAELLKKARKNGLIPEDIFTTDILNIFKSHLMHQRRLKSDAHPAEADATASDARLAIHIVLVFINHCMVL